MSRRSGQVGYIEKKGNSYRVRFLLDVPGRDKRVYKSVFLAPVSGPGSLNTFERKRRAKEIIAEAGANDEVTACVAASVDLNTTFRQQADWWIENVQTRKRKPIKAGTAASWKSALRWINQRIGDMPLSAVDNRAVRDHIVTQGAKRYSPKMLHNIVQVVKMVVASSIDEKGEARFPIKWNHDFIDLPVIAHQRKPMFTAEEVTNIIANADGQLAVLYALLAGSGLRIGEALALQVEDVKDSVIKVKHGLSAVTNELQTPKTKNGVREVDLHSSLAVAVNCLIAGRELGFVFQNESGGPLCQANVLRRSLHAILKKIGREACGFHAFRRFRNTHLRKSRVPDGLIQYWMGHAGGTMTDNYDRVREDLTFRRFTAEQVGLGFVPPVAEKRVSPCSPQNHPQVLAVGR